MTCRVNTINTMNSSSIPDSLLNDDEMNVPSLVSLGNSSRSCLSGSLSSIDSNWMVCHDDSLIGPFASGRYLATGSTDGCAKFWDLNTGKELRTISSHSACVGSVDLLSNGRYLLTGYYDNTAKLWDMESGKPRCLFRESSRQQWVPFMTMSSAGRYLALPSCSYKSDDTIDQDRDAMMNVKLWDIETGNVIRTLPWQQKQDKRKTWYSSVVGGARQKHSSNDNDDSSSSLEAVALSFDNQHVASLFEGAVKVWNIKTGKEIQTIHVGEQYPFNSIALSAYGEYLVTRCSYDDEIIELWRVETGKKVRTFVGHTDTICCISLSLNGQYLATGSWDNTAKVWYLETGELIQTFVGHNDWVTSVGLSPDGRYLVTGSNDHTAKLWNLKSSEAIRTFDGHSGGITSVAVSSDDRPLSGKWENHKKGASKKIFDDPPKKDNIDDSKHTISSSTRLSLNLFKN